MLKSLLSCEAYAFELKLYFNQTFRKISPIVQLVNIEDIVYLHILVRWFLKFLNYQGM
jgi:hypothetical protein